MQGTNTRRSGGKSTTNDLCRQFSTRETGKRLFMLVVSIAAICSSVLTIYSCKFFSYKEIDVFHDAYNNNNSKQTSEATISYEPFEYLPKAGVGLFSYYMGDPTGKGVMMNDRMCFYYCDDFTDYQWLSSNNQETWHVDIWVLSRYCSILAPIFGLLALLQILIEISSKYRMNCCGNGAFLNAQMFLIATFFQTCTFLVLFASPIMYSTSEEDYQQWQPFCFSETSNVRCKMDTGSMFSLGSTMLYLMLALVSFFTSPSSTTMATSDWKVKIEIDTDQSDSESNTSEIGKPESNESENNSKRTDDGSVWSTIVQYFNRNHACSDIERVVLDDSNLRWNCTSSLHEGIEHRIRDDNLCDEVETDDTIDDHIGYDRNNKRGGQQHSVGGDNHANNTNPETWIRKMSYRYIGRHDSECENSLLVRNTMSENSLCDSESEDSLAGLGIKFVPLSPYSARHIESRHESLRGYNNGLDTNNNKNNNTNHNKDEANAGDRENNGFVRDSRVETC